MLVGAASAVFRAGLRIGGKLTEAHARDVLMELSRGLIPRINIHVHVTLPGVLTPTSDSWARPASNSTPKIGGISDWGDRLWVIVQRFTVHVVICRVGFDNCTRACFGEAGGFWLMVDVAQIWFSCVAVRERYYQLRPMNGYILQYRCIFLIRRTSSATTRPLMLQPMIRIVLQDKALCLGLGADQRQDM